MEFSKGKCHILHLGWGNPGCTDRMGNRRLKSSTAERGLLVNGEWNMSQQCPGSQEDKLCPGDIRPSMASPAREGIVPSALHWGGLTSSDGVPQYKKDIKPLESFQIMTRRIVKSLKGKL
ncbi:hypothetical protein HGM15179_013923 [Zosterops borbonicus]|uniref:Uncharacterized protein n=1 Tax=Zosterops borbonicus TaxID=364589 RepID=A0A8K1G873_9PASS|nr:hypothetical protein HGM15179_013923 [Zosterops borbonicus]